MTLKVGDILRDEYGHGYEIEKWIYVDSKGTKAQLRVKII